MTEWNAADYEQISQLQVTMADEVLAMLDLNGAHRILDVGCGNGKITAEIADMPQWQLHDLRRTTRSLMSRAGVLADHAERVLGHIQPGVEAIYDRHAYFDEKAEALAKLAQLIDAIVHPRDTVVTMRKPTKGRR